jgi:type IV secretory pathway TraG/TraD family ATPase VirD4
MVGRTVSAKLAQLSLTTWLIGEREIVRIHESRSTRSGTGQTSKTRSEQHVTEFVVLPSEIEQLPDLAGYLKLASSPSWLRVNVQRS